MRNFNYVSIVVLTVLLASCSSDPYKKERNHRDQVMSHISQKPEALDGEFDAKYNIANGRDGSSLIAVGTVRSESLNADDNVLLDKAIFKAKSKLVASAPSEFKKMVQQSIGDSTDNQDTGFEQSSILVTEVRALTGFRVEDSEMECKRFSEPTAVGDYRFIKVCKAIVRVPLANLEKAYKYTLKGKYGIEEKTLADQVAGK